jgi:hypothetical protein
MEILRSAGMEEGRKELDLKRRAKFRVGSFSTREKNGLKIYRNGSPP